MSNIKIYRKPSFVAGLRKLGVFLDDVKIGSVGNGKEESFDAPSGGNVSVKGFWQKSNIVELDANRSDSIELECGISPKYVKSVIFSLGLVFLMFIVYAFIYDDMSIPFGVRNGLRLVTAGIAIVIGVWLTAAFRKPGTAVYLKEAEKKSE